MASKGKLLKRIGGIEVYQKIIKTTGKDFELQLEAIQKLLDDDTIKMASIRGLYGNMVQGNYLDGIIPAEAEKDDMQMEEYLTSVINNKKNLIKEKRKTSQLENMVVIKTILQEALDKLPELIKKPKPLKAVPKTKAKSGEIQEHLEVLFGDIHIGKLMKDDDKTYFDTPIALQRIKEYQEHITKIITTKKIKSVNIAILGDIIEQNFKHYDSMIGCDSSTSEQISTAITEIHQHFLLPIYQAIEKQNGKLHITCITGNHENTKNGSTVNHMGRVHFSWAIYNVWKKLAELTTSLKIEWVIPTSNFYDYEIFNRWVLYEHGTGVNANVIALYNRKAMRANQSKKYYDYIRVGDKHNVMLGDCGDLCVNGAFFNCSKGLDFSSSNALSSHPAQVSFIHNKTGIQDIIIHKF